jgi:uncharacterized protein
MDDLRQAARQAQARLPTIRRIVLFGSLAAGTPTPHSDADLLVVVASSEHAQMRDRLPEMLKALSPLPCPLDLFVLTAEELEAARRQDAPLVREALANGIDLL